jgi:hypothetical protein
MLAHGLVGNKRDVNYKWVMYLTVRFWDALSLQKFTYLFPEDFGAVNGQKWITFHQGTHIVEQHYEGKRGPSMTGGSC